MKPVVVIDSQADFETLTRELARQQHIAIDTESNSFYAYFERVCLIQISTVEEDYIVDPFVLEDLDGLGEILLDSNIEKIFHAASNDVLGLKRDFHFRVRNLFDTATASKLLGYKQLGLAKILVEHFGVSLNKKWQRHDWGKRPLKQEQLDYARLDTHYLIELRHRLAEELLARELSDVAQQSFERICEQEFQERPFQPNGFNHLSGAQDLDDVGKKILKALYLFRDHEARRRNRAPFRVLPNETLVRLALNRPRSVKDFFKIKGMPRPFYNSRAARNLLDVIRKTEQVSNEFNVAIEEESLTTLRQVPAKAPEHC